MTDFTALAERYLAAWNATGTERRALIEELFTENAGYTDPLGAVTGWDDIEKFFATAAEQFAGLRFSLHGAVDGHHDIARFTWHLGPEGAAEPLAIGFDVLVVENDRIARVHGFLDKVPG
ncbi:nuclear transport factor 2 family protein [Amycolatopsis sp. 195334CR]|uniref:nuclear transport factor 2 family protein n=1 Tax=Amycolatopsis sp. 195334CR TaxID=2814588 RepID=UPI001A8F548F|nr:nuclear transport factor 2 family protein [Amycolatopsis sp. 195334CR]MBN6039336.1 nuclear transport factor 2 family protein [Amycolatopsis sp. 195334CR]